MLTEVDVLTEPLVIAELVPWPAVGVVLADRLASRGSVVGVPSLRTDPVHEIVGTTTRSGEPQGINASLVGVAAFPSRILIIVPRTMFGYSKAVEFTRTE